jgi:hypothetical protein
MNEMHFGADTHSRRNTRPVDRTAPDFMADSSLPDVRPGGLSQQTSQEAVERLRHSGHRGHRFAQGDDLENRTRFDVGVIVRREIEGHSGYFFHQAVEVRGIRCGGNFVAMTAPHGASASQIVETLKIVGLAMSDPMLFAAEGAKELSSLA